jgi:predicted DNA-binding protein
MHSGRGGHRDGAGRPSLPESEKKKMVTFKLSPHILELLEAKSKELGKSKAALVEEALEKFLN